MMTIACSLDPSSKPCWLITQRRERVDGAALEEYLTYGFVPHDRSIFRRIKKLPAAHTLEVSWNQWATSPKRYWQLDMQPDESRSLDEWIAEVDDKFKETVRAHLIADVPVGAFLSGGIDSSGVVAALAEQGQKVRTFSIGFEERRFSELPFAREVADKLRFGAHRRDRDTFGCGSVGFDGLALR